MKTHDPFLELAAAAIDFGLSPGERTRLDAHLAECPLCARSAVALRADALVLAGLPGLTLPERRGAELLYEALHPARVRHPLRLVAIAALLALLALGSLAVGAELLRRLDEDRLVVLPVPTESPAASEGPGPDASPVVPAEALAWEELGSLNEAGIKGLVAFDGGYVAYGFSDSQGPVAWFSTDGRTWEANPLGQLHLNCPGWGPDGDDYVFDADVDTGTTNGSQVLLAGTEQLFTDAACSGGGDGSIRMAAWVSSDGRTWQRSVGFAPGSRNARASGSWVASGRWQVADEMSGGVWESADGLDWVQTDVVTGDQGLDANAAASGSTLVGVVRAPFREGAATLSKWDGTVWSPLEGAACAENPVRILGPEAPGSGPWVVAADPGVCASLALEDWQAWIPPTEYPAAVIALANTRYGVLLAASCMDRTCPDPAPGWQFLGQDGRTWAPIGESVNALLLADGPAGVIALGAEGRVWRLVDTRSLVTPAPAEPSATIPVDFAATPWVRHGEAPGDRYGIVGFDGGYVAMGQQVLWYSPDGRAWQRIALPPLEIEGAREPYVTALASNGAQVLAVGSYGHEPCRTVTEQGGNPACVLAPIAWVTDNGVNWRRSDPWVLPPGVPEVEGGADASAAWAVPGGWEAARVTWDGAAASPVDVWRSADGITWERLTALESAGTNVGHGVAVAADGTRVRWDTPLACPAEGMCEWTGMLRTSPDGTSWTELETFPGAGVHIAGVAPPIAGQRSAWVVVGTEIRFDDTGGVLSGVPRLWTSSDLSAWTAIDLPMPDGTRAGMAGLAWTADRIVAVATPSGDVLDGFTWVSSDGRDWTRLADHQVIGRIAAGPSGIIGFPEEGWDAGSGEATWRLGD